MNPSVGLRATKKGLSSITGFDVNALGGLLASESITMIPLFDNEDRLISKAASLASIINEEIPDLSIYYQIDAPDERLDYLANLLRQIKGVEAAYIEPPAKLASIWLNEMVPIDEEAPLTTPDFTNRQGYLDPAPAGIDAKYAWTYPGGKGSGVKIIDIESGWRFTHEDLRQNQGGVLFGNTSPKDDHGTAVLGVISGDDNGIGIMGICPDAHISAVSTYSNEYSYSMEQPVSKAIYIAACQLNPGDIILLEVHFPGPRATNKSEKDQYGYIAVEWWEACFIAIRYAVVVGRLLVVEAAGNGGQNLDDPIYDVRPETFSSSWKNPFNPANPSSGAIMVGAGNPPAGIHNNNRHPDFGEPYVDRARCFFSNYGSRVDVQGWGWEVTSTGYGDLQNSSNQDKKYTDKFSGTSSASPIIVGVLGCIQGILRSQGKPLLNSSRSIELLRNTGSPQQDGPGFTFIADMSKSGFQQSYPSRPATQRIGNRPNLKQLISRVIEIPIKRADPIIITTESQGAEHPTGGNREQDRRVEIFLTSSAKTPPNVIPYCTKPLESNRELIEWAQSSLSQILKIRLPVTGVLSKTDSNAIKAFQQTAGLPTTGTIDSRTQNAMFDAGASQAPCAQLNDVNPFHNGYQVSLQRDQTLQSRLNQSIAKYMKNQPNVPFTIVQLGQNGSPHLWAGYKEHDEHYSASLLKVAAIYAAYELRASAERLANANPNLSGDELFEALDCLFTPRINAKITSMKAQSKIMDKCPQNKKDQVVQQSHLQPSYRVVFEVKPNPNPNSNRLTFEFKAKFVQELSNIVRDQASNIHAHYCIHGLGYGYIAGSLDSAGFFNASDGKGIWLSGDYKVEGRVNWPYMCISSENDNLVGMATTTYKMAELLTLLCTNNLVNAKSSSEMLNILALGKNLSWIKRYARLKKCDVTHSKLGEGNLKKENGGKNVYSEACIIRSKTSDQTNIVVYQNYRTQVSFQQIADVIENTIN